MASGMLNPLCAHCYPSLKPNETVVNAFRDGHWFSYVFLVDK